MPLVKTFIVEDSPVIRDNLIAALEELAEVKVVGCAADESGAVRWLTQPTEACDLLIIDIFLKSGSGLGVLRAATHAGLEAKRVVLTNYATPDMRRRCADLGADRVFDKSHELEDLIAYCARLAGGSSTVPAVLG
jgi:DNA-binding NarL/FixJ family response regulator